jgi:hypothetical protein
MGAHMPSFRRIVIAGLAAAGLAAWAAQGGQALGDPALHPALGHRPAAKIAFPVIADWSTLQIRLVRTPCFGRCPAYSVEIRGDGTVVYEGEHFVEVQGVHLAHVPDATVRRLFDAFVRADFFWTYDEYRSPVTDLPTSIVTISFDGHSKTVVDYAGEQQGLPKAVADLEDAIDAAAGTRHWIEGRS